MNEAYFWKANKVVVFSSTATGVTAHDTKKIHCENYYCVDTSSSEKEIRYGKFSKGFSGWEPIPLENFPKEFRAHLLLLGVT